MKSTDYMRSMMKTILSHKEKDGIKQELQDCIDDLTDKYIAMGMTPEKAEEEAVRQMGDPVETGEMFNEVYQPRFEWKVALYMALWIAFVMVMRWAWFQRTGSAGINGLTRAGIGVLTIIFSIQTSYAEKSGDFPKLWWRDNPMKQHWQIPGFGIFTTSGSEAGLGIGLLAANVKQAIIMYGFITIVMLLQRIYVEIEQDKMEHYYLYKEGKALKDFDFEAKAQIEDEKHYVRSRGGQKIQKGDELIITGMIGFTFIVEKCDLL